MAEKISEGKFVPALAILVLLLIAAAGGWIWVLQTEQKPTSVNGSLSNFALAQAVSIEVDSAFEGSDEAFRNLSVLQRSVSKSPDRELADIRSALPKILVAQRDLQSMQSKGAAVSQLLPFFVDTVYKLEGQLSLQRQPAAVAHLGRLRVLAQLLVSDIGKIATGWSDSAELIQRATDTEMELTQIVTSLLIGDPKLAIQQITDVGAKASVNELSGMSNQLNIALLEIINLSDQVGPAFAARKQIGASVVNLASKVSA
ncbi:MAG: hypothetical protein P8R04_03830, partial [Gammaproteobacteria bacterium]|nr:hypothetical protein [Gammaproteobacteria bacterium]